MKRLAAIALALGAAPLLVFAAEGIAQEAAAIAQEGPSAPRIGRDEALGIAAANNLAVLAERLSKEVAELDANAARRDFVPAIVLRGRYDDSSAAGPADPDGGPEERERAVSGSAGVEWSTPTGASFGVAASGTRGITGAAEDGDAAALTLSAGQRLLRGGWRAGAAFGADSADVEAELKREAFRSYLNDFLVDVHAAYWELAFAEADVAIKTRSLARARSQFEDTAENIRRGILPETDIYVVEENVVSFEQQVLSAEQRLDQAQSALAQLLAEPPGTRRLAADSLDAAEIALPPIDEATREALAENPSLNARRLSIRRADIGLAYRRSQALPALDLEASFSLNGVGDDPAAAWAAVGRGDDPRFGVGLSFSMPLWLGPDLDGVRAGRADAKRQLLALKLEETRLAFAVRDSLAALAAQKRALGLSKRLHELAAKKLDAEIEKYRNGVSRLPEVVRFQRELDGALMSYRAAQKALLVDWARFRRTLGAIDRDAGVFVR